MAHPPNKKESGPGRPEGLEMLNKLVKETAESYKEYGIQVTDDCRVDTEWFEKEKHYKTEEIEKDNRYVKGLTEIFEKEEETEPAHQKEFKKIAEYFEQIVPIVFNKALRAKEFIAVRTALYDDYKGGLDTFIIHKETGKTICSIDETNSNKERMIFGSGDQASNPSKFDKIIQRNKRGVRAKYAPMRGEDGKFYPGSIEEGDDVPLVHLSVSREKILEFIETLASARYDISSICNDFFSDLVYSLYQSLDQIKTNIPEQNKKMEEITQLISKATGTDPNLSNIF